MIEIPDELERDVFRFILLPRGQKAPPEPNWTRNMTKQYRYDDPKLLEHLKNDGNVGIVCGKGRLLIIDADSKEFENWLENNLPKTFTVLTPTKKLKHFYYFCDWDKPITFDKNKIHYGEGRNWGQYIVAPSSRVDAGTYEVVNNADIAEISRGDLEVAAFAFGKGLREFGEKTPEKKPAEISPIIEDMLKTGVVDGTRDKSRFMVIKDLWNNGISDERIKEVVLDFNARCMPPEEDDVVEKHIEYLLRTPERYLLRSEEDPFLIRTNYGASKEKIDDSQFFEKTEIIDGMGRKKSITRFKPKALADFIKNDYIFKTMRDTGEILIYENKIGVYCQYAETIIKTITRDVLDEKCSIHLVNETVAAIKDTTYIDRKLFNTDNSHLVLANGVVDLNTMELSIHNPSYYFTTSLPVNYVPDAKCDAFLEWLEQKVKDEAMRMTIQEMFGYCLLKDNRLQKAFLLFGDRRTGKSTLLKVLRKMLGENSITAMSLQFLTEDNFAMAYIYGKLANVCADLSSRSLRDTGKFMVATGEDALTLAKKHQDPFTWQPTTKFIFSCNTIPASSNRDMAFYRRWCLIHFREQTEEDEVDEKIMDKIANDEAMSGILLWAIEGAKRIITNGRLSYPIDEFLVKDLYERNSDSITSFVYGCIEEDEEEKIKKRDVYAAYKKYCETNKLRVENQIQFGRMFKEVTGCGTSKINDIPAYAGVRLKIVEEKSVGLDKWI